MGKFDKPFFSSLLGAPGDVPALTIPAEAGTHSCHGHRPSPVWSMGLYKGLSLADRRLDDRP